MDRAYYGYLADLVVVFHFGYVAYVVFGQLLILIGILFRWPFIRAPWFRLSHFFMIWIVALEAVYGVTCPLTTWETRLRALADQPYSQRTFVGRLMDRVLFVDYRPEREIEAEERAKAREKEESKTTTSATVVEPAPASNPTVTTPTAASQVEPEIDLTPYYIAFALLTTLTFFLVPPRLRREERAPDNGAAPTPIADAPS